MTFESHRVMIEIKVFGLDDFHTAPVPAMALAQFDKHGNDF